MTTDDSMTDYHEDVMKGKDPNTGRFTKGNNLGKYSRRRDGVKEAIRKSLSDEQAAAKFKKLLNSDNETIALKAVELWFAYRYGRPTKIVEQDITTHVDQELDDEINNLIKGLTDE